MTAVVWMTGASLISWLATRAITDGSTDPEVLLGMLGPLVSAIGSWVAYVRAYEAQTVLVVNNLSRFAQPVELDLRPWQGLVPVEMMGGAAFPAIGERPYFLTLGPHSFLWFLLNPPSAAAPA